MTKLIEDMDFANDHPIKVEVVGGSVGGDAQVVSKLPETGETGTMYFVLKEETKEGDIYDEYMWLEQEDGSYAWEHIGVSDTVEGTFATGELLGETSILPEVKAGPQDGLLKRNEIIRLFWTNPDSYGIGYGPNLDIDPLNGTKTRTNKPSNSVLIGAGISSDYGGLYATIIGQSASRKGNSKDGQIALGAYASSGENYAIAIGSSAKANHEKSTAIGRNIETTRPHEVRVGSEKEGYKFIGGVKPGENDDDVTTVAQVKKMLEESEPTLYDTPGNNEDGAMTQKAATELLYVDPETTNRIRIGKGAKNESDNSIAIGTSASATASTSVVVGNKASSTLSGGVGIGYNATSGGSDTIAIGIRATTQYAGSIAIGGDAVATGGATMAIGDNATVEGVGNGNSIAIGNNATANSRNSVCIGNGSTTTRTSEFSVGSSDSQRFVSNVKDGEDDHDAVTVGQMNEALENAGGVKTLTTDDYNYPTSNPTKIALWLLEPGVYKFAEANIAYIRTSGGNDLSSEGGMVIISGSIHPSWPIQITDFNGEKPISITVSKTGSSRTAQVNVSASGGTLLSVADLVNNFTTTSWPSSRPLSAAMGNNLNERLTTLETQLTEMTEKFEEVEKVLNMLTSGSGAIDSEVNEKLKILNTGTGAEERE